VIVIGSSQQTLTDTRYRPHTETHTDRPHTHKDKQTTTAGLDYTVDRATNSERRFVSSWRGAVKSNYDELSLIAAAVVADAAVRSVVSCCLRSQDGVVSSRSNQAISSSQCHSLSAPRYTFNTTPLLSSPRLYLHAAARHRIYLALLTVYLTQGRYDRS